MIAGFRLVPRTRSSHDFAASAFANFGFKSGTRIIELLVSFDSEVRKTSVLQDGANFGIGTLAQTAATTAPPRHPAEPEGERTTHERPRPARDRCADLRARGLPPRRRRGRPDRAGARVRSARAGAARRSARSRRHLSDRELPRHAQGGPARDLRAA